jgi:hypothetical protein
MFDENGPWNPANIDCQPIFPSAISSSWSSICAVKATSTIDGNLSSK